MPRRSVAICSVICVALIVSGCGGRKASRTAPATIRHAPVKAKPKGVPVVQKDLSFTQDGLHNCGTVAMLVSWAHLHPDKAADLVRKQPDGSFVVSPAGADEIRVTATDLAEAAKARMIHTEADDRWAEIVLTAFTKLKCGTGTLDFRVTDWIYAGEIGTFLTGSDTGNYAIKMETQDANGRMQMGKPVPVSELEARLKELKGKPLVAYTNRLIHIWSVLDYDDARSRLLVRNPRSKSSIWMPIARFQQRFQVLVYVEE